MKWLNQNVGSLLELTVAHLALAVPAILLSLVIAVPIGWTAQRLRWARDPALALVGVLYAIPSLPLFVLVPVVLGIGIRSSANAIIVLTVYATAIMVRSAADAFSSVPLEARMSATAIGYSTWHRFWSVDLPLAIPVMLAGLRVVVVSTVSLVTVGSVIGIPSLGTLFTDGFQRGIVAEVAAGLIVTVLIALVLDGICILAGRALTPWARAAEAR
ncbi:ABC transporter permease subunit [Labedella populi]|uniref:ABC transporter permease subunit n=1 Tax=Labedella populi TaxID=2498850 RepID=A0A444Q6F1_9MICO|nr:ABC transporter permease subunit [Labedella populi]RWZ59483.1 ABC transporter permease subunit [Labedella populi]